MRSTSLLFIMVLNPCPLLHQRLSYLYIKVTWWAGYKADSWARLPEIQFCGSEAQPRNLHTDTTLPHPQAALVQCMVVHTLRNEAPNPLRHVLKKTVTKGKLMCTAPVSAAEFRTSAHHPGGTGTTDLTEISTGVATTVTSCHILPPPPRELCRLPPTGLIEGQSNLACRAGSWGLECRADI